MAPPAPPKRVAAIPAQYAKFITAVLGEAVAYVQLYGITWHLQAALVMAGAALAVLGVPNGPKSQRPVPPPPPAVPSNVSITPLAPRTMPVDTGGPPPAGNL